MRPAMRLASGCGASYHRFRMLAVVPAEFIESSFVGLHMASRANTSATGTPSNPSSGDGGSRGNVVITGMGVVSPIGLGPDAYWQSLCDQQSGVGILPDKAGTKLPVCMGAAIKDFEPKQHVKPRKALKVMCREIQTGFAAAGLAFEQAQLDKDQLVSERLGVVYGSEMLYCEPTDLLDVYGKCLEDGEFHIGRWGDAAMAKMYPLWMLMYLPNMTACHVGIANDARGPNNTICQGDVSSLLAMIEAASIILRGHADVMIVGGSSSRLSITPMLYRGISQLSGRVDTPAEACRPFDANRDGSVNGEGAAAFIFESEQHAAARGAKVLARLRGWGLAFGNRQDEEPTHGWAIGRSIEHALARAALGPESVGHVNADAAGLVHGDSVEARAINHVLGQVPVTAPKSFFGDLGSSGGAVQMVASVLALQHGQIPVTLNYSQPAPDCPVQVVHGEPLAAKHPTAVVLSQAQTGQAVALVLDAD